jgi:DNA-binding transcriptional LysR family regulator
MHLAADLCLQIMSTIEPRHLQALIAVAEEGTFTDAAIRLGISQSAVSRSISALERILDVRLVERTTRSVALTEYGNHGYRAALVAVAAIADVVDAAQGRFRPLRLGFAWSALGRRTSEVLQSWRTENPGIVLEVHRFDDLVAGLIRGAVDIAVIRSEVDEPGIRTRPIFTEARMAALPVGHRLAGRESVELVDLIDDTVLTTANGTTTLELWPSAQQPRSMLRVDNIDEWLTEIAGGLAVGVTPESTSTQHAHPGIRFVPVTRAQPVTVYLAWPGKHRHPATDTFLALVDRVVASS